MLAFLGQIKAAQFVASAQIHDAAVGIGDFFEVLTGERVDGEHQILDRCWQFFQINADGFIIASAFASTVVAGVLNGTVTRLQLTKPDQIERLFIGIEHDARSIQVDITAATAE